MKIKLFLMMLILNSASHSQNIRKELTSSQIEQIKRAYGMFIHFGINTLNDVEWVGWQLTYIVL